MDISAFYQTFFDEADELLAEVEQNLLELDPDEPDMELLNAIFRAAHSIKGGAGTFNFTVLQQTTHLLENLLDGARRHEMRLSTEIINLFLETKDIMQDQIEAYKANETPNQESFEYICQALQQLALEVKEQAETLGHLSTGEGAASTVAAPEMKHLIVKLTKLKESENALLLEELSSLGTVIEHHLDGDALIVTLDTNVSTDDISAVLCFVIDSDQISFVETAEEDNSIEVEAPSAAKAADSEPQQPIVEAAAQASADVSAPIAAQAMVHEITPAIPKSKSEKSPAKDTKPHTKSAESSIRVAVEKVDQLINLVGELVITQSMLAQCSSTLDPVEHSDLLNGMSLLERGARDLQESVMSIRMMPMEYVFSRFPRLVRDLAGKLDKKVDITLLGSSTELDKSLIERIIDPLTHLVRNSLDHGLESPEKRLAAGKNEVGNLTLSAEHQGGNIHIEVIDDGAGLNRERILAKALSQGMSVSEDMSDYDVGNLIFAPGFSTAEKVTDVSGRGVGMDVVKRNIQEMGGHVEIHFKQGLGTTIRIVLPLTLAILDGMSVKVAGEIFILPLNAVMESLQPQSDDFYYLAGGEQVLQVRGEYLPLVALHDIFDVKDAKTDPTQGIIVILQSAGRRYALLVDQLIGQHQVVVKNLESNYRKIPGISGATILGDGSVALIVDVSALQTINQFQRQAAVAA